MKIKHAIRFDGKKAAMCRRLLFGLALVLLAACGPQRTPLPDSGIEGQVLLGPACPGPVQKGSTNCADKPYQATLTVLTPAHQKVTQFTTDADGRFRVNLEPGNYILHPESSNTLPHGSEQKFTVAAGQFTELVVQYDSGMR